MLTCTAPTAPTTQTLDLTRDAESAVPGDPRPFFAPGDCEAPGPDRDRCDIHTAAWAGAWSACEAPLWRGNGAICVDPWGE